VTFSDVVAQGQQLLWSTSDATLRLAILETVKRYCTAHDAAASTPQQPSDDDDRRRLLLGTSSSPSAAAGSEEDLA
jgi:hypothetical protein